MEINIYLWEEMKLYLQSKINKTDLAAPPRGKSPVLIEFGDMVTIPAVMVRSGVHFLFRNLMWDVGSWRVVGRWWGG